MPAGFISYADDFTYQITDDAESMVFLGRTEDEWDKTTDEIIATDSNGVRYKFVRISQVVVPNHGVGVEIYNQGGKLVFSSLVRPLTTVMAISLMNEGRDLYKELPKDRSYAVAIYGQGKQSWAVNIRLYPGSSETGWDDIWTYDEVARFRDIIIEGNVARTEIVERVIRTGVEDVSYPGVLSTGTMFLQAMVIDVTGM